MALAKSASQRMRGIRRAVALVKTAASTRLLDIDNHAEIAGFCLSVRKAKALRRQSPAQPLSDRLRPTRHVPAESPLIESGKLINRQHDLKAFAARLRRHGRSPCEKPASAHIAQLTHNGDFLSST